MPGALFELLRTFPPSAMPEPLWLCPATIHSMSSALPSYEEAAAMVADYAGKLSRIAAASRARGIWRVRRAACLARHSRCRSGSTSVRPLHPRRLCMPGSRGFSACVSYPLRAPRMRAKPPAGPLPPNAAWEIMTGAPVPAGADAVVMIEHVEKDGGRSQLRAPAEPTRGRQHRGARRAGSQRRRTAAAGTVLGPAQIAWPPPADTPLSMCLPRPRVAILTTGDELVPVEREPGPGQIRNSNAPMLAALVAAAGGAVGVAHGRRQLAELWMQRFARPRKRTCC